MSLEFLLYHVTFLSIGLLSRNPSILLGASTGFHLGIMAFLALVRTPLRFSLH